VLVVAAVLDVGGLLALSVLVVAVVVAQR